MLLMQKQGLLNGRGWLRRRLTWIGRQQRCLAPAVKRPAQAADGARPQLQPLGNDTGRTALAPQYKNPLTIRERKGCRHGTLQTASEGWTK
jgi:hypothetical protein